MIKEKEENWSDLTELLSTSIIHKSHIWIPENAEHNKMIKEKEGNWNDLQSLYCRKINALHYKSSLKYSWAL